MPTNQQRREAAKRKLQRQLVRRHERERNRRQRILIVGVIAAVLVIAGGVWFFTTRSGSPDTASADSDSTSTAESSAPATPCTYTAGGTPAKAVTPPTNTSPANTGTIDVTFDINGETAPATLNRKAAPCTVNSFLSLASQGFYDGTACHRLTKSAELNILQCGDPTGKGNGGPGYTFADENSENTKYPVGTIAMANSGIDTNGSQFFIVYGPTTLSGSYTVFGTMSAEGMKIVQSIAEKGVVKNAQDGKPVATATIDKVTIPADSVSASGDWATSASATEASETGESAPASSEAPTGSTAESTTSLPGESAPAGSTTGSGAGSSAAPTGQTTIN